MPPSILLVLTRFETFPWWPAIITKKRGGGCFEVNFYEDDTKASRMPPARPVLLRGAGAGPGVPPCGIVWPSLTAYT